MTATLRRLTGRGRLVLGLGGAAVLIGWVIAFSDLVRVGSLLVVLPLGSAWAFHRGDLRFELTRRLEPVRVPVGVPSRVEVHLTNRGYITTPLLHAVDQVPVELGDRQRWFIPRLEVGDSSEVSYPVVAFRRGVHRLGPLTVLAADPLGLTRREVSVPGTLDLVVTPQVTPLRSGRPSGSASQGDDAHAFVLALHGEDDVSTREYRYGDDLRRIHWPASAHTGDLMVRQEERPSTRRAMVLLDTGGQPGSMDLEWRVEAAASIVSHLVSSGYQIRFLTRSDAETTGARDETTVAGALDALARVRAEPADALVPVLHLATAHGTAGCLVVALLGEVGDTTARTTAALRHSGTPAMAVVTTTEPGTSPTVATMRAAGWLVTQATSTSAIAPVWHRLNHPRSAPTGVSS